MPFPVTAYAVGRMEACRCCALGGAANLEYSTSLYTDFPVASGLGVSTRQGSFIPTIVPHDGVHTWPDASPPTRARAVSGGRYWPPSEGSHTTHARCGYLTWPDAMRSHLPDAMCRHVSPYPVLVACAVCASHPRHDRRVEGGEHRLHMQRALDED